MKRIFLRESFIPNTLLIREGLAHNAAVILAQLRRISFSISLNARTFFPELWQRRTPKKKKKSWAHSFVILQLACHHHGKTIPAADALFKSRGLRLGPRVYMYNTLRPTIIYTYYIGETKGVDWFTTARVYIAATMELYHYCCCASCKQTRIWVYI